MGEQFEVLHGWSRERGHLMQAIAGIPHYYRRFGYEMSVWMGAGRRMYAPDLPKKPTGGQERDRYRQSYRLRPAEASDAEFLLSLHRQARSRYLLTCSRGKGLWRYEVAGRNPRGEASLGIRVIENANEESVGYICHTRSTRKEALQVDGYEIVEGLSWLEVTPFVLGELAGIGRELADDERFVSVTFVLGEHHPLYEAVPEPPLYRIDREDHYSFYVRVPDLQEFLRTIKPALERRLARSVAASHTGDLRIDFYGSGLYLKLERGRLVAVERWEQDEERNSDAASPGLTFLQILFGHRSLEELDHAFPDCSPGEGDARVLLKALFPRRPSDLWPVF